MARTQKLQAPAIVLTGWQVAGRGRGTNTWWSSAGSVTVTFAFPIVESRPPHHLPLLAGVAIRRTIEETTGIADIKLKWPNDLLLDGRKLCGLLCERVGACDLVGMGLNVNLDIASAPPLLRPRITSLSEITHRQIDQSTILLRVSNALQHAIANPTPLETILQEYNRHNALTGRRVSVRNFDHPPMSGLCEGLDEQGRLILRSGNKLHHIVAGHVEASSNL